jgi:hypothetical protein
LDHREMPTNVVSEKYTELWPPILGPWTNYLIACRKAFGGDLDKMLILAAIATMTLADAAETRASYDDLKSGRRKIAPRPTNYLSIANFTAIPKETVRRKTDDMIAKGWVTKGDGGLVIGQKATTDFEHVSADAFRLLARIHMTIESAEMVVESGKKRTAKRKG